MLSDSDIEKEINKYIYHPKVIDIYTKYKSLDKGGNRPELCYFGINFKNDKICSFKFYFAFFRKLTDPEILLFLPHVNDFNKYYHLWEASENRSLEHSGCTFEVKFKENLDPVLGFHYRLKPGKEAYELIGYPNQLPFSVLDLQTRPGINYEYSAEETLRKKYYYFDSDQHKKYIAERFKVPFAEKAAIIEYTESDNFAKVNVCRFDYSKENMNRPNAFGSYPQAVMSFIRKKYGLINLSDGYYENSEIRASYFFNTDNSSDTPFDDPKNYHIDTLKLFHNAL